jgi:hypothetical protein
VFSKSGRVLGAFDNFCDAVQAYLTWDQAIEIRRATKGLIP